MQKWDKSYKDKSQQKYLFQKTQHYIQLGIQFLLSSKLFIFFKCIFINFELTKYLTDIGGPNDSPADVDHICEKVKFRTDHSVTNNPKSFENLNRLTSKLFSGGVFEELFNKKIVSRKVIKLWNSLL